MTRSEKIEAYIDRFRNGENGCFINICLTGDEINYVYNEIYKVMDKIEPIKLNSLLPWQDGIR